MPTMPAIPDAGGAEPAPFRPRTPVVIGLLGGIAAGKSAVARLFAAHGLQVVDADGEARQVAAEPAVLDEVARQLGPGLVVDGKLDRAAAGALVFRDPAARSRLEAIFHPRIRARVLQALDAARAAGRSVLLDAPLLLEGGLIAWCDHVVFVDAAAPVRAARAAARGWAAGELARREAAQAPLADKRARAGFVVQNDGDLAASAAQVAALLGQLAADRGPDRSRSPE